jgi:predicted translin family RNA/ssDNA-binding protein
MDQQVGAQVLYVLRAPNKLREEILLSGGRELIRLCCEVVLNIAKGELEPAPAEEAIFDKYKGVCLKIIKQVKNYKTKIPLFVENTELLDAVASTLERYVGETVSRVAA